MSSKPRTPEREGPAEGGESGDGGTPEDAPNKKSLQDDEVAETLRQLKEEETENNEDEVDSQPWVERQNFSLFIGMCIVANSITIGIEADDQKQNVLDGKTAISDRVEWYVVENLFLVIFLFELCARLLYKKLYFFTSFQNWVDFVLVVLNIADTWVMQPSNVSGGLRAFTVFRVIRILRLVRIIKILQGFHQLFLLVSGLANAMRTLFWVAVMLFIMLYTCAIYMTLIIGHDDESFNPYFLKKGWDHEEYFGNIWRSMFTLFQVCTLDGWSENVARHILEVQPTMVWFFLAFVLFASYGLLNLVVGVIVESTLSVAKFNNNQTLKKKQEDRKTALQHIRAAFEQMDEDGSGSLSVDELKRAMENPEVATRLKMIDFPLDDPERVFNLIDVDGEGELLIDAFIKGCMRLSGQAQSKDILEVLIAASSLGRDLIGLEDRVLQIQHRTKQLDLKTETMVQQADDMFSDPKIFNRMMRMKIDID
mmetsp:Transcript_19132/g.47830  ORF Transcript_19132/g.47830 Transcript_19132/m.47830 type:complete len:481 (+) Transcript_19132:751-2193(+)|eukprot:CAMPEP_0179005854 /NCGR_PEP_ID=MMETSP0795-20121207/14204_1 /TAXON_ID=88552 /ORGANISM="Amoebophrya sp., Strain Ameob2" /LENGTH=480 /DNA_ID=CAMNT_0020700499 /DNA_START=738 /DNA_END=2180 /DNA_ORIENTATION=+